MHDPTNKWDKNTFDIFMYDKGPHTVGGIRIGCVQRNLAQLLVRVGAKVLAARLIVSKDSYDRDVFEVEVLGNLMPSGSFLSAKPQAAPQKKGFFDDDEPNNDNVTEPGES